MTLLHSPGPKIGGRCKLQTARLSFTGTELYRFEVSIGRRPLMQFKKKNWGKIGEGVIRFLSETNSIFRITVSLSVNTPTAAILIRFWWNFTQTDASDFIICPLLFYSSGTDNDVITRNITSKS